ncbi:unnamed protein product [Effrenium voratum]|nr:unnamed protein product [Effrenium voratum]
MGSKMLNSFVTARKRVSQLQMAADCHVKSKVTWQAVIEELSTQKMCRPSGRAAPCKRWNFAIPLKYSSPLSFQVGLAVFREDAQPAFWCSQETCLGRFSFPLHQHRLAEPQRSALR